MATTIKLIKKTELDKETYYIYKDDWCESLFTIYPEDTPETKEKKVQNALEAYKNLKQSILNPAMIETIIEETI